MRLSLGKRPEQETGLEDKVGTWHFELWFSVVGSVGCGIGVMLLQGQSVQGSKQGRVARLSF